jgi:hypothetical protein
VRRDKSFTPAKAQSSEKNLSLKTFAPLRLCGRYSESIFFCDLCAPIVLSLPMDAVK